MPTFLDESGDSGAGPKANDWFRLAAVWFETADHVRAFEEDIARVRKDVLKVSESFEFKFARIQHEQRVAFYEAAAGHPFRFVVCEVSKPSLTPADLTKARICEIAVGGVVAALQEYYLIAEACKGSPLNERVTVDQTTDAEYFDQLRAGFFSLKSPRKPGAALVKSVKPGKSHTETAIQLVDMVCGAVGRKLGGEASYYRQIEGRQIAVLRYPVKNDAGD